MKKVKLFVILLISLLFCFSFAYATECPVDQTCIDTFKAGDHACTDDNGINDPDTLCKKGGYNYGCCYSRSKVVCWNKYKDGAKCTSSAGTGTCRQGTCIIIEKCSISDCNSCIKKDTCNTLKQIDQKLTDVQTKLYDYKIKLEPLDQSNPEIIKLQNLLNSLDSEIITTKGFLLNLNPDHFTQQDKDTLASHIDTIKSLIVKTTDQIKIVIEECKDGGCEPKECVDDGDCKHLKCVGAYCDNWKCRCPSGESDISCVKVSIIYERLNDARPKRTIEKQIQILEETHTDLVFRATWRWRPMPYSCDDVPPNQKDICEKSGYSFEQMKTTIQEIKKENPNMIIIGAIPAQRINKQEVNEVTGETFDETQVWNMALDPQKWGISSPTKEELQNQLSGTVAGGGVYPDITNPKYQEIFLSWAKKQIDSGMDGIWIDLLYTQAEMLKGFTKDANHLAVKESYEAASEIVDEIHKYGKSKGKDIYVGTWSAPAYYPYTKPKLDFVTLTPSSREVLNKGFYEERWDNEISGTKKAFGNIPIFAFIDWAGSDNAQLATFSQKLSKEEQGEFLETADEFFQKKGIHFVYPVHGGVMGMNPTFLAYGEYNWYDSLAPEFQTYDTIRELALKKAGGNCGNNICETGEDGNNCPEDCCISGDGKCPVGCTSLNDDDCKQSDLEDVKVASLYETVTDGKTIDRSLEDVTDILKETKTDFVFRGFWRFAQCPDKCDWLPAYPAQRCEVSGYSYEHLMDANQQIKKENPDIIISGAIGAQYIWKTEWDPETDQALIEYPQTWNMALDPSDWEGISLSKKEFQCEFAKHLWWIPDQSFDCLEYDPEKQDRYFPDITNQEYQKLLLNLAKKQINSGADAIWIDMLFTQTRILKALTKDPNHSAVKESFEASSKIVDEIHRYGHSKGKYIYVGSWTGSIIYPYPQPNMDFVTVTPSHNGVSSMELNKSQWDTKIKDIKDNLGDVPIFAFIDWAMMDETPLGVFSQELSPSEQREFLGIADEFFKERGVNVVYPVHGGYMGQNAKILSFGKSGKYDSLAPEFQTYEKIKELAQKKAGEEPECHTHEDPSWVENNDYDIKVLEKGCTGSCGTEYKIEMRDKTHPDFIPHCGEQLWVWLEHGTRFLKVGKCYRVLIRIGAGTTCGYKMSAISQNEIKCPECDGGCGNQICESDECDSCPEDCEPEHVFPGGLSPEYEEGYKEANRWLDEKLIEWKPAEYKPMKFTGFHLPLSYDLGPYTDSSDDLKFLDMLDELDVNVIGVGVYISEEPQPELMERGDILVNEIHKKGKELKVWHFGGTFHKEKERKEDYIKHGCYGVEYIIQRWQPEYLSIVHELSNQQEPRATRDDWDFWKEYIETVAKHAKDVAEDEGYDITTAVALQAYPSEIGFVDYIVDIPDLDIIGFDVYGRWGLCEDCLGGDTLADKINQIHSHKKEVWIEETWLTTQWEPFTPKKTKRYPGFDDPKRAWWDSRWMTVITYYAQNHDVEAVEPFFTNYFIFYPDYNPYEDEQRYASDYKTELRNDRRTPTFCGFKGVIEEVKSHTGAECGNQICESGEDGYNCPEDCCISGDGKCPAGCTPLNDNDCKTGGLSDVKVASVYENVVEGIPPERTIDDIANIFAETKTDLILRGFWKGMPTKQDINLEKYNDLSSAIAKIKEKNPKIIFVGALPAQRIWRIDLDPSDTVSYSVEYPETWNMALNPEKWNLKVSKVELQCKIAKDRGMFVGDCSDFNPEIINAYFPDMTNEKFQDIFLNWAKLQIDSGADAIWIDMLFKQVNILEKITADSDHKAIRSSYIAISKVVDEIHRYGKEMYGKHIYVGAWSGFESDYPSLDVDFVTIYPFPHKEEIYPRKTIDESRWDEKINDVRSKLGDIPIFAFIDWGVNENSPTGRFSQNLTSVEQGEFLESVDEFAESRGITFVYPIHGGFMGGKEKIKKKSFGKYTIYDSLAPEFQTYETIKELAQKKAGDDEPVCGNNICESNENGYNCPEDCCISGDGKCPTGCTPENDVDCKTPEVKVETICTDGIDNDGDGLTDNDDGDCWIREGPIYETHPYYYNGKFNDLTARVPDLAKQGIKTIYLMPIWEHIDGETPDNLIYLIDDYYNIDATYGTPKDLKRLVNTIHDHNMKIILDLVTCCTLPELLAWNNNWTLRIPLSELQDKAKDLQWKLKYETYKGYNFVYYDCDLSGSRPFCEFAGKIVGDQVIPSHYPHVGWGSAIDRTSPEVIEYFTDVAEHYASEYDIDGWRVDSPVNNYNSNIITDDHSSVALLRSVKKAVSNIKPDTVLISENPSSIIPKDIQIMPDPVFDEMCEATYSYPFKMQLKDLKTSEQLINFFMDEKIFYNRLRTRHIETHDSSRINAFSPQLNRPTLVLISTISGIPMIQAGQEIGATNDWFHSKSNPSVDWANGDYELREFYKKVLNIRNNNNALKYGTIENVWKSGDNTYAYSRTYEDENVIVTINFNNKQATSTLNIPFKKGDTLKDELSGQTFKIADPANFQVSVPAYGSRILVLTEGEPSNCDKCGWFCTANKCHSLGECYYTKGWIYGKCNFCTLDTKCLDYKQQTECTLDSCNAECRWMNNKCIPKECTNNEDCKYIKCLGAYCNKGICICPNGI